MKLRSKSIHRLFCGIAAMNSTAALLPAAETKPAEGVTVETSGTGARTSDGSASQREGRMTW